MTSILCDIDGVLADVRGRLHYVRSTPKNWKAFFAAAPDDPAYPWAVELLTRFAPDHEIVLVTGRPESERRRTVEWLELHEVPYRRLVMRGRGDFRKDVEVKRAMLRSFQKDEILFVVEDRAHNVAMYREEGLTVLHVAGDADPGDTAGQHN